MTKIEKITKSQLREIIKDEKELTVVLLGKAV
jgi:hypothetical protein